MELERGQAVSDRDTPRVRAPMVLVDYVAAHVAVHLVHKNHTRAYWAELARLVADVEGCRAELRRRGGGCVW